MNNNNSLTDQLDNINRHQANYTKLQNAYLLALTSNQSNVSVDLENVDGSFTTFVIPSNMFLLNELQRIKLSVTNMAGLSGSSKKALVNLDGSFRELFVSSFRQSFRQPLASDIIVDSNVKVSTNAAIENLLSPLTEVSISLSDDFNQTKSAVIVKIVITEGDFTLFSSGMGFGEIQQILAQNDFVHSTLEFQKSIQPKTPRYYGQFTVVASSTNALNQLVLEVDKLSYSDSLNIVTQSRTLEPGDKLLSHDGSLSIVVVSTNADRSTITCNFESGIGSILPNDVIDLLSNDSRNVSIRVPVRMNERSIIFVKPVDSVSGFTSPISVCSIFDSSKFTVTDNNLTTTFDEFFASKVADMGRYFDALIRENTVPASLGEKPSRPVLLPANFNVIQINEHLTNTPNAKKLKLVQKEKDTVSSQIDVLNSSIGDLNIKIAKGNYSNDTKKAADIALRQSKITEKLEKTSLLSSLVDDVTNALNNTAEQSITPKYRARGFWQVQPDIPSDITNPQKIVQYQIRYRYVSNTGNTANATQMSYKDTDENVVNATFTPWTFVKSEPLERIIDNDGNIVWSSNSPTDADIANINQLDIPIVFGESVELQVRAISEAGWPTSPLQSDWSELIRVEFPQSLLQESDIASIARKNSADLLATKIQKEFGIQGITEHTAKSFREQERYFGHTLDEIASGFVTPEQKQISAKEYVIGLQNRVQLLEELVNKRYAALTIQILDESLRTYDVNNFSTIKLFAGYYTDNVDLAEPDNYGSIVEKTFYLKISNRNAQTVEMLSISPGILIQQAMNSQYDNVPILDSTNDTIFTQRNGQIFYNRNVDINGTVDLYETQLPDSTNTVDTADIDISGAAAARNIVHINSSLYETVKLVNFPALSQYVVMTTGHPAYADFIATGSTAYLQAEFERMQKFTPQYRTDIAQTKVFDDLILKYAKTDKYLVGKNSIGANLFTALKNVESYQVNGIDTASTKEIYASDNDSILIPIIFQYRMTDGLGNPNGDATYTRNTNFEYTKKIGVDLLVAGQKFVFDIVVNAKFRPSSVSNSQIGIQVTGQNNQSSIS